MFCCYWLQTVINAGVGGFLCRFYDSRNPAATKCLVITLYTLVIIDITCGTLHVIYSALGMRKCYSDIRTGHMSCNPEERPRILLTGGFNAAFGIIIAIISIVFTIYISLRQRLHILTGLVTNDEQQGKLVTCCFGKCICYLQGCIVSRNGT
ncbi:hypothetical protein DPMN_055690 [Dreissena polymorpha]|uniref:Uncharacterized protein n=1 Tax=Dreissena polymorpha TaxID=45954 RepID=A0A9D4CSA1_DREPO|nr:hypothetical protein DPMN_055690 [Dreissena polymorpha]